ALHLSKSHGVGEFDRDRGRGTERHAALDRRRDPRAFSLDPRAQIANGRPALGRGAADAGHRPRVDAQPAPLDPRPATRTPLAPLVRGWIWNAVPPPRAGGQPLLWCDKNLRGPARLAARHYVLERGRVRWSGDSGALGSEYETIRRFVGL